MPPLGYAPVVHCQLRGEQILLPHQTHGGIYVGQHYWPTGSQFLTLVCNEDAHVSVYSKQDVQVEEVRIEGHNGRDTSLWIAEFECGQGNCNLPVVVHARAKTGFQTEQIADLVFSAKPGATCPEGHTLSSSHAKVIDIKRVQM
jgi:hypothetical protein